MRSRFQGCFTAIVTPMNPDGSIDYPSLQRLIDWQIGQGIHGLVVAGSTGEAATLTDEEQTELIRFVVKTVNGRCVVIGGASSNVTRQAIRRAEVVSDLGVDMLLSTSPYYNKPTMSGIVEHYRLQSAASKVPVIAYNVPGRTGSNITADTTRRLEDLPNMGGIKEASASVVQVLTVLKNRSRRDFHVWLGEDSHMLPLMACGADGLISVASNEIPGPLSKVAELALAGKTADAAAVFLKVLDLLEANFWESNPIPVKYILSRMGFVQEQYRLPLVPASDATKKRLDDLAASLGLYHV
ncbi:MAG: 4-hydroxy-tetrahydrodipicolinate synthase [Bacteroidetes bacterium]|nr:4-hydroxy-tetrahydrodipicolinate synthase [Bacteroidota bacterium]